MKTIRLALDEKECSALYNLLGIKMRYFYELYKDDCANINEYLILVKMLVKLIMLSAANGFKLLPEKVIYRNKRKRRRSAA